MIKNNYYFFFKKNHLMNIAKNFCLIIHDSLFPNPILEKQNVFTLYFKEVLIINDLVNIYEFSEQSTNQKMFHSIFIISPEENVSSLFQKIKESSFQAPYFFIFCKNIEEFKQKFKHFSFIIDFSNDLEPLIDSLLAYREKIVQCPNPSDITIEKKINLEEEKKKICRANSSSNFQKNRQFENNKISKKELLTVEQNNQKKEDNSHQIN